jgi:3-hydroxyacyl-[acyl-carrier-protein] dehydratase
MNHLTTQEVLAILPHRYPFLMIDTVTEYTSNTITALKNVSANEPYIQGHFPNNPIMPGVMMVEAMAQASTILAFKYVELKSSMAEMLAYFSSGSILFVGADQIKFKRVVRPGSQLCIHSTLTRHARNIFEFDASILVDGIVVCEGKLKAAAGM